MLNFNEFQEHIKNTILDYLPEEFSDAKVDLQQVAKNNETLTGIIIHQEKVNISPEADEMMYIMSNTENVNGAAAIIDPNNMDLARSYMQDDFYILPSSVHEVLLVKQNQMSVEELEDMVKTVNASAVALQDRLSDHVYKYDFARHEIYRADQEQQRQAELNAEQARTHATGR